MLKYIKYYLPIFLALSFIFFILEGSYYPTIFAILFSSIFIFGDWFIKRDKEIQSFSYPIILDFSIYLALPILYNKRCEFRFTRNNKRRRRFLHFMLCCITWCKLFSFIKRFLYHNARHAKKNLL